MSLVARLQSFTLVTKTVPGAPVGNRFLSARRMVLNGNSAFAVPEHSFLPGGASGQRRLASVLRRILFADSGGRIVARERDQAGDNHWGQASGDRL